MPERRFIPPRVRGVAQNRDASLIIIAAEGKATEKRYFEDLASPAYYHNARVHVKVLPNIDDQSSPEKVMAQLDAFRQRFQLGETDQLWLVVDFDRWGEEKLSSVTRECRQKGYRVAVSNPCFELWLLLHLRSLDEYSAEEIQAIRQNRHVNRHDTYLDRELSRILQGYDKANLKTHSILPNLSLAIERARAIDHDPESRWPNDLGTRVYLLATEIIRSR
jgi:hypothetical protein